ncbi:caffeoyl- O-methyltransferase [Olea europaea subsp. europaea]|uniref:Caffeoyl- O-methyltransferase n=1 Tax=Olea europaea subsp. europaea TaxID=158383 RepID=A0A8S0SQW5_OLEEU|nr:caffeoyl- O-methyltransferase [Olea europaea subsp. europaea]
MAGTRGIHEENEEIGTKSLLQSDHIYQYVLETSVYPRETESMKELRNKTETHSSRSYKTSSADVGQFLNMILKLINAKNTMQIGIQSGYVLLSTALAIPNDGKILCIDYGHGNYQLYFPVIEKAGMAHKIDYNESSISLVLKMSKDEKHHGAFDFIYVDAHKTTCSEYHKTLIELVRIGGVIVYDKTLLSETLGTLRIVSDNDASGIRYYGDPVLLFNEKVASDPRVEICQVPVGIGVTLCRRIR